MERILIIKLGAIGDVVHSLPVLATLRACHPKAHLAWAVEEKAAPVLEGNRDLDELILLERKKMSSASGLFYFRRWLQEIRKKSFDAALDLHNLFKSGIIAYASHAPVRIGFRKLREGNFLFMNHRVKPQPHHRHAVEKYLSLLEPLGLHEPQWVRRFPLVWDPKDEVAIDRFWVQQGFSQTNPVVALNPGANWPSKCWSPDRYAKVADRLTKQRGIRVLVLWGPGERPLAEAVAGDMTEKAVIAPETTLKQLMVLIKRCRLLISGDSGPLHIAAALNVPTVALFGPSDPKRNGPYGEGHTVVQSVLPPATHWRFKERGSHWMKAIMIESVIEAAMKQLENDAVTHSTH